MGELVQSSQQGQVCIIPLIQQVFQRFLVENGLCFVRTHRGRKNEKSCLDAFTAYNSLQ